METQVEIAIWKYMEYPNKKTHLPQILSVPKLQFWIHAEEITGVCKDQTHYSLDSETQGSLELPLQLPTACRFMQCFCYCLQKCKYFVISLINCLWTNVFRIFSIQNYTTIKLKVLFLPLLGISVILLYHIQIIEYVLDKELVSDFWYLICHGAFCKCF